ncbi:hypothetical protein EDD21DRAFT_387136 [Dissophora ornata]|nr:hypothetical protein EDD21DRAFT_387136 [Dissophora ornata]
METRLGRKIIRNRMLLLCTLLPSIIYNLPIACLENTQRHHSGPQCTSHVADPERGRLKNKSPDQRSWSQGFHLSVPLVSLVGWSSP